MIRKAEIAVVAVLFVGFVIFTRQWSQGRSERIALREHIAQQQKIIDAAAANEKQAAVTLKQRIAEIETLKKKIKSPADAAEALPAALSSLPLPIKIHFPTNLSGGVGGEASAAEAAGSKTSPRSVAPEKHSGEGTPDVGGTKKVPVADQLPAIAMIPSQDLKPIYDAVQNCKECELQLNSLKDQLADARLKLEATQQQRNAALGAAKGGSRWTRFKRGLEWFAIGAAVGALATHKSI